MTSKIELLRDGGLIGTFSDETGAMEYIHHTHSYSFSHALLYEGYSTRLAKTPEMPRRRLFAAGRIPARSFTTVTGGTK